MLSVSCTNTEPTDRYQIQRSWNPGVRESTSAGIATSRTRAADVASDGMVFPIA